MMYLKENAWPFHSGETAVQTRLGVKNEIEPFARRAVRPFMPDQHREFFENQPFLVIAARDEKGRMWSSFIVGPDGRPGFISSPTPTNLFVRKHEIKGDALAGSIRKGSDVGILGIEFDTKRRNRVNGRVTSLTDAGIEFEVDQSFGNCPQHIKLRWWSSESLNHAEFNPSGGNGQIADNAFSRPTEQKNSYEYLTKEQAQTIESAETIFLATGYRDEVEDPRYGCDASHRGGPPGFVKVLNGGKTLAIPDYSGNNMFNTIGNLELDDRMGITIPRFSEGGMIQLTGRATVDWDADKAEAEHGPGARRVIVFSIEEVVNVGNGSLPIRWLDRDGDSTQPRTLKVAQRLQESEDVVSFVLRPSKEDHAAALWPFRAGQHLPITLKIPGVAKCDSDCEDKNEDKQVLRTYSLSCGPDWGTYRISVKKEPHGAASSYLHDRVRVGDEISAHEPAGDFFLSEDALTTRERTTVLVSAGVGITPMISMLHQFVLGVGEKPLMPGQKPLVFVHGARDGKHHPFKDEVKELANLVGEKVVRTHIAYSKPTAADRNNDSTGRVDALMLAKLVDDVRHAEFYLCGPVGFMADIQDSLEKDFAVDSKLIHTEAF